MSQFDEKFIDQKSFSYNDLLGQDSWTKFVPIFGSLTIVGDPNYSGRFKIIGKQLFFQVSFSAATSIASVAGTSYFTLPISAKGLSGLATMTNDTTNIAVGLCHVDADTSRVYLPTQTASGNTFLLSGWVEI